MAALARIALVAGLVGLSFGGFLWLFGLVAGLFGFPNAAPPALIVGLAAGGLAGCCEACRTFVEARAARLNGEIAARLGCKFSDCVSTRRLRRLPFTLFRNPSPSGRNRMAGAYDGRRIDVFDFGYTVTTGSSGDGSSSSTTYTQTVYRFPGSVQGGHAFLLQPRHWMMGLFNSMTGVTEIELSPLPDANDELTAAFAAFRKQYQISVAGETQLCARDWQALFHPFVVSWLAFRPGWSVEVKGGDLLAWRPNVTAAGRARLLELDQLGELVSLMQATDLAAERLQRATVVVRTHDRTRGLAGFLGVCAGVMLGATVGGLLGTAALSLVLSLLPNEMPRFPIIVLVFFGAPIALAGLGGLIGFRLGQRSEWGRRFAGWIDPRP